MQAPLSCVIVGCGYVGTRLALRERSRRPVLGVVRSGPAETALQAADVLTLRLDLDAETAPALQSSLASAVDHAALVYLAPPPEQGETDPRVETLLKLLGESTPAVFVYASTTGVYGDTQGATVDESTAVAPVNDRSKRRVAAEASVRAWCAARDVRCVVLRIPGIYGPQRLPLERLRRGEPALRREDAGPGNRIHVDDLVAAIVAVVDRPDAQGVYNVTDGDPSSTTDYLVETAAAAGLPGPPLVSREEALQRISPGMLSFLLESRRVDGRRLREELGIPVLYPTMQSGIHASLAEMRAGDVTR